MTGKQEEEKHRRKKDREAEVAFFPDVLYFLMTAEKNKSTDLSSFSFLMVGEAYEMRGSEMRTLKRMKNSVNGNGHRERERERKREADGDQRRVWTSQSKKQKKEQKGASHCGGPPSHLPTSLLLETQCEMENGATHTVVHIVVNNHQVRDSEGDLTLRLSMQGST